MTTIISTDQSLIIIEILYFPRYYNTIVVSLGYYFWTQYANGDVFFI